MEHPLNFLVGIIGGYAVGYLLWHLWDAFKKDK